MGKKGQGWRRFLLFTALTKGRKGSEYVGLFTYFSFEAWLRIVFADGPRQAINALTLYSVLQLNLVPVGEHAAPKDHSPVAQFFINVRILAEGNREQAAVYFGMLFTLIIWVFSALGLLLASLMYITYLWHHIPTSDGGLAGYCRRRIDSRLYKIVGKRIEKALAKESKRKIKEGDKAAANGLGHIARQPTVPILVSPDDATSTIGDTPTLSRKSTQTTLATQSTLPLYESRANSPPNLDFEREPTVPRVGTPFSRPANLRSNTASSLDSNAPLLPGAAGMGVAAPPPLRLPMRPGINKPFAANVPQPSPVQPYGPDSYGPPPRSNTNPPPRGPPRIFPPSNDSLPPSQMVPPTRRPIPAPGVFPPSQAPFQRAPTAPPQQNYMRPPPQRKPLPQKMPSDGYDRPFAARPPPLQHPQQGYEMQPRRPSPPNANGGGYVAFNPARAPPPMSNDGPANFSIPRQLSPPVPRAGTAPPSQTRGYHDSIYAAYGGYDDEPPIPRAGTAGPGPPSWR